ncbi:hypothetical protein [Nostoc sp. CALU 546]|uniref:hypothetical protein n=1 Tax=Nostoc sp. CALU 546 TaxID=1867241 RepID=UPI003B67336C
MASGQNKPNGLTVILPEEAIAFVEQLPIEKFHGIGAELPAVDMDLTIAMMVGSHIEKYLPTNGRQIGEKILTQ